MGRDIASVLADILFSNAVEIISEAGISNSIRKSFLKMFSETYEMTAWGQILDCLYSQPKTINPAENIPERVSTLKTAYYTMYYPMLMGYSLSGRTSETEIELIKNFSLPLGIAFQIRDDILGVFGKSSDMGKPHDSDIYEGKLTLLIQSTMENSSPEIQKKFLSLFLKKSKSAADAEKIRTMIIDSGALEKTGKRHAELISESINALSILKLNKESSEIIYGLIKAIEEI
jgi:geranylgeranyl diphosphate synthase type I